jgi:hypothetical protein
MHKKVTMADLQLIKELADSAMEDWKDELPHWDWQWNTNVSRLGCCKPVRQTIFLSIHWMKKVSDDEAFDTFLHELAHALVHMRFTRRASGSGHMVQNGRRCAGNLVHCLKDWPRQMSEGLTLMWFPSGS